MRRSTITTTAAIALVIQTAALTAGALWAGWRFHQFASSLTIPAATPGPSVKVTTGEVRPGLNLVQAQDLAAHAAYSPPGA